MDNACIPLTRINQHPISKAHNDLSKLRPENAPEFWLSVLAVFTVGDGKNLALIGAEGFRPANYHRPGHERLTVIACFSIRDYQP